MSADDLYIPELVDKYIFSVSHSMVMDRPLSGVNLPEYEADRSLVPRSRKPGPILPLPHLHGIMFN
jgi:hypothetical protein